LYLQELLKFNNNGERARELPPHLRGYVLYLFTSTSLSDIMKHFSSVNIVKAIIATTILVLYIIITQSKWSDNLNSHRFVTVAGLALVLLSTAAGLGFCALLRIPFNAATTQVVPFISISLGMYSLYLLLSCYKANQEMDHKVEVR